MIIAGIDVSKDSVTVCLLEKLPDDFRGYAKSYKPYKFKVDEIGRLLELPFDAAVLEPTGGHYSRLWAERIKRTGREVRWVGHQEVAAYRKSFRLPDKTDKTDGLAIACYGLERWDRPNFFLTERAALPLRLRELYLQLQFLNRAGVHTINRCRQQLAHEWPEVAHRQANRAWGGNIQGLWLAIAGEKISQKWQQELDKSEGLGLSEFTRELARMIVQNEQAQLRIERDLDLILADEELKLYLEAMDLFQFGPTTSVALLSAIYPFEKFKGHRSPLGAFKMCCGMAQIWHESGDYTGWVPGGSVEIRKAMWLWAKRVIPVNKAHQPEASPEIEALRDYYLNGTTVKGEDGPKQISPGIGNQRLMRVSRRALTMLYRELKRRTSNLY
jgi:hypothetical protein